MMVFHDEVEIEDFQYLENGEDVVTCPSCSIIIKVMYDKDQFTCGETVPAPSVNKELVKC
uniref:DPH-type MB domain-containing protein n=1 Tax=Peromyscus maniculatus bairdii TaxID=230844 RepID=A0A8C8TTS4_PERMB